MVSNANALQVAALSLDKDFWGAQRFEVNFKQSNHMAPRGKPTTFKMEHLVTSTTTGSLYSNKFFWFATFRIFHFLLKHNVHYIGKRFQEML